MQSRFFFSNIVFTQSYCSHSLVVLSCLSWLCCLSFLRCSVVLIYPDCVVFFVQDCVQFVYQDHVALFIRILLFCYRILLFGCSNSELSPHSVLSSHQDFVFVFIYLDCVVFASSDNIALHHRLCLFVYPDCVVCISELIVFSVQIKLLVSPDCTLYFSIVLFCPRSGFRYFGFPYCVVLYVLVVMLSIHAVLICLS